MRWRTRGGDAGNRGDTGRACLSPGPGHAQAGQIEGGAGTSTRPTVRIAALFGPASLPSAAPPGDSRLQRLADLTPARAGQSAQLRAGESRGSEVVGKKVSLAAPGQHRLGTGRLGRQRRAWSARPGQPSAGQLEAEGGAAARTRRRRPRRPRWEVPYKAAACAAGQTPGGAALSADRTQPLQRVQGAGAYLRGTNLAPQGLLTAVWGFDRVLRTPPSPPPDRHCPEPLCPGGPRVGAEGAPGGRGMRGPRHGLGGV